jgi:hypothetical protein
MICTIQRARTTVSRYLQRFSHTLSGVTAFPSTNPETERILDGMNDMGLRFILLGQ